MEQGETSNLISVEGECLKQIERYRVLVCVCMFERGVPTRLSKIVSPICASDCLPWFVHMKDPGEITEYD